MKKQNINLPKIHLYWRGFGVGLLALIISFSTISCKKYSDDSPFTLQTPTKRLVGTWETSILKINNELDTFHLKTTTEFAEDGEFNQTSTYKIYYDWYLTGAGNGYQDTNDMVISSQGTWELDKEKENILLNYVIDSLVFQYFDTYSMIPVYDKEQITKNDNYTIIELTKDKLIFEARYKILWYPNDTTLVYNYEMTKVEE